MSLYPSLEDMQVHKVVTAQQNALATQLRSTQAAQPRNALYPNYSPSAPSEHLVNGDSAVAHASALYPGLSDFMGLELTQEMIALNMPEYARDNQVASMATTNGMIAPLSSQTAGLKRSQLSHALREVMVCKGNDNKVGIRVQDINKGIFVTMVCKNSPAALVGLRFGDQILQINDDLLAGYSADKVNKIIKNCPKNHISMVVRDRPFERVVTMHKDSVGNIGFSFANGRITTIVKDSSAARNGLLIDHHLLEINGQHVVGMKDKDVIAIIQNEMEPIITVTIIPSIIYDHMMKKMPMSWMRSKMDYTAPDM